MSIVSKGIISLLLLTVLVLGVFWTDEYHESVAYEQGHSAYAINYEVAPFHVQSINQMLQMLAN